MSAFYSAARDFLATACDYLIKWCPFQEEIVHHATWLDFEHRLDKPFSSVEYFIVRYSSILTSIDLNKLEAQFLNYQLVDEEQIPEYVKASGRVDDLWAYLRNLKEPGTANFQFNELFAVAEVVLTIPHSNAGEERLFSLINKNKTPSRDSLQQEGTLSSIMIVKTHISNPLQWVPTPEMLEKAK